jgi:hypothetical protein
MGLPRSIHIQDLQLSIQSIEDAATHASVHPQDAFVLMLQDGREIRSSAMRCFRHRTKPRLWSSDAGQTRNR